MHGLAGLARARPCAAEQIVLGRDVARVFLCFLIFPEELLPLVSFPGTCRSLCHGGLASCSSAQRAAAGPPGWGACPCPAPGRERIQRHQILVSLLLRTVTHVGRTLLGLRTDGVTGRHPHSSLVILKSSGWDDQPFPVSVGAGDLHRGKESGGCEWWAPPQV